MDNDLGIPRNAKDTIQRILIDLLKDNLITWYGVDSAPIVETLPAHVPSFQIRDRIVDAVFGTADGALLHVEFQSGHIPSLDRFLEYAVQLAVTYHRKVNTVVVYLGDTPPPHDSSDYGSVKFKVQNVVIGHRDGQTTWRHLVQKAGSQTGEEWTDSDLLDLAFVPFMRDAETPAAERALEAARLASGLPGRLSVFATALIAGLTSSFVDGTVLNYLKEVIRVNELLRQLEEEARARGLESGFAEGHSEGLHRGRHQGLEEGRQQGLEEGRQQGLEEGRQQGLEQGRALVILAILRERFGGLPTDMERAILKALRTTQQDALSVSLATAENLDAVRQLLESID